MTGFLSGNSVLSTIALVSFQSTVCLLLIVAAQRLFGGWMTAKWRYALWSLLLLRMIIPFNLTLPVIQFSAPQPTLIKTAPVNAVAPLHQISSVPDTIPVGETIISERLPKAASPQNGNPISITQVNGGLTIPQMLNAFWLAGALCLFLSTAARHRSILGKITKDSAPPPQWVLDTLARVKEETGLAANPKILATKHLSSPTLTGVFSPCILLPYSLAQRSNPAQMRYYLLHELVHIKNGDIAFSWLWSLALSLHWFNPLLWWAGARITRDRELACDEGLLEYTGGNDRTAYGQALLDAASAHNGINRPLCAAGLAGIIEQKNEIQRRLDRIMNFTLIKKTNHTTAWITAITLAAVSFTQVWTFAQTQENPFAAITDERELADQRDEAADNGELILACEAEMRRVKVREESGHSYKDKIDLTGIFTRIQEQSPAPTGQQKNAMIKTLQEYAKAHEDDPDYGWRVWQLCSEIALSLEQKEDAVNYLKKAIEVYPHVQYTIPSKHSKFQHLLNDMAMMLWDEKGVEAAQEYMANEWKNDPRFLHFHDYPWRNRYEKEQLALDELEALNNALSNKPALVANGNIAQQFPSLQQVTVLLTPKGPLYEDRIHSWDQIMEKLAAIKNPSGCFLALGVITEEHLSLKEWRAAQAKSAEIVQSLGFDHFSDIGLQEISGLITYQIERGDTLAQIASKFGTTVQSILTLNNKSNALVQINERLLIYTNTIQE